METPNEKPKSTERPKYLELPTGNSTGNPDEFVKCPKCERQFQDTRKLSNHFYHAHGLLYYQCLMCNYLQRRPGRIKVHVINTHRVGEGGASKYWKRVYKNEKGTRIRLKEPIRKEPGKDITNRKNYYKKRTMHWIRCFNCYDCSSTFKTVGELFSHVKVHKGSKH